MMPPKKTASPVTAPIMVGVALSLLLVRADLGGQIPGTRCLCNRVSWRATAGL